MLNTPTMCPWTDTQKLKFCKIKLDDGFVNQKFRRLLNAGYSEEQIREIAGIMFYECQKDKYDI